MVFEATRRGYTILGPWASGAAAVELATTVNFVAWTLAQCAAPSAGLAPLTLPVWAIEPWFNVAFHYPNQSSVHGVLV